MSDESWRKALDKELVRSGLVLDDPEVLEAMEHTENGNYRFLPLKVSKTTGNITGDALASAERLGKLGQHIQLILGEICKELASGNIAADPFWRGADKNACRFCDYTAACHFEDGRGGDHRRWLASVSASEFWARVESAHPEGEE
jgi:ATP-dependent helicase/nuclease subunit B